MKKTLVSALALLASFAQAGETKSFELKKSEIEDVTAMMERLEVASISRNARCSDTTVLVTSTVRQMNPAKWEAEFNDGYIDTASLPLTGEEKSAMIKIFDRVNVPAVETARGGFLKTEATIQLVECKGRDAEWTISYEIAD